MKGVSPKYFRKDFIKMAQPFYNHSAQLGALLRNTSEFNAEQKAILGNFVDGFLRRANISVASFQPAQVTFFSYEEIVDSAFVESLGEKAINLLCDINITFRQNSASENYTAKVIYPIDYTTPPSQKSKPFTPDILPILEACNRFSKKAKKNTELYILAKKLKDMAKEAKKAAKKQHASGEFVFTQNIPTLLVSDLSNRTTKTLLSKGVSFKQIDVNNTQVTMTFVDKS